MGKKKIKTFSVDEDIYKYLTSLFKEEGVEVSLSYYVDKCMKNLADYVETLEGIRAKSEEYSLPLSFIINTVAREPKFSISDYDEPGKPDSAAMGELYELQIRYEAEKKRIPLRFWRYLRTGKFKMSADKKYIVNKETGYAYIPNEDDLPEAVPEHDEKPEGRE